MRFNFVKAESIVCMSTKELLYGGLISRGEIFMDWTVKTFRGYIFEGKHHFTT